MHRGKVLKIIIFILPWIILGSYILMVLSLVFSKGVCCGDDAYLSVIAKNLSRGLGYSSSIQPFVSRYKMEPYDPLVGTGPTIILPAALFMEIFGNTYWAPGLANVAFWSLLLIIISLFIRKYNRGWQLSLFTFSFLFLAYSTMTYHFEQWYALLGEVPAALLIITAVLYYYQNEGQKHLILTGVIFSLAVQAKFLSLLAFFAFLIINAIIYFWNQREALYPSIRKLFIIYFLIGVGFLIPLMVFELWKLVSLGPTHYINNWRVYLKYLGSDGARVNQSGSLIQLFNERLETLIQRFGILLPNMGILLMLVWSMVAKDEKLKRLFLVLTTAFIIYAFWWVFFSIGWARYFIIGLILLVFVMSLPLLSQRSNFSIFLYFIVLVLFSSNNWSRFQYPFEGVNGDYFKPTPHTEALIEISHTLSAMKSENNPRFVTEWWATAGDIEYIMNSSLNFTTFQDNTLAKTSSFIIAVNKLFMNKNDKDFVYLLEHCEKIQELDIYVLVRCSPEVLR